MELADLAEIVDRSTRSAFRLETLPVYLVPQEAAEFAAWRAGRPQPLQTPASSPWLRKIQEATARGYRWYRVHIIDNPDSDYTRFEMHGYRANAAAGEEIYLADRAAHVDLEQLREDFWLIDEAVAVRMLYDGEGHFLRPEPVEDVAPYLRMRSTAMRYAETLNDYLVRTGMRLTA